MALDVHVLPLGRFWAGEYTTATERFAELHGTPYSRIGNAKAVAPRTEAYQMAKGVRLWMERRFFIEDAWADEGDIVFSEQFSFEALHALQAYAAHHQWGEGEFAMEGDFANSPLLVRIRGGVPTNYPHLIAAGTGFHVPMDFKHPTKLMGQPPMIGSSVQLMFELASLRESLGSVPSYDEWKDGAALEATSPTLKSVKFGALFLYHACWLSLQHRLPVVFDG